METTPGARGGRELAIIEFVAVVVGVGWRSMCHGIFGLFCGSGFSVGIDVLQQQVAVSASLLRIISCSHLCSSPVEEHGVICCPFIFCNEFQKLLSVGPEGFCGCRIIDMKRKDAEVRLKRNED